MMAFAPRTVQNMPDCLRREPITVLQPASMTPDPTNRCWLNIQVMRRTHNSLLRDLDVDPKIRAEQMGHTVDVNENVYTKTSLEARRVAVNKLEMTIGAL